MKKNKKPREFIYRIELICKSDNGAPFYVPLSEFFYDKERANTELKYYEDKMDHYRDTIAFPIMGYGPMVVRYRKL